MLGRVEESSASLLARRSDVSAAERPLVPVSSPVRSASYNEDSKLLDNLLCAFLMDKPGPLASS